MTVKTNAQGAKRKELVNDIAEWLAVTPRTVAHRPCTRLQRHGYRGG